MQTIAANNQWQAVKSERRAFTDAWIRTADGVSFDVRVTTPADRGHIETIVAAAGMNEKQARRQASQALRKAVAAYVARARAKYTPEELAACLPWVLKAAA